MSGFLSRRVTRRRLLASGAAAAFAAPLLQATGLVDAAPGRALKVLDHEEVQEAPAFARGKFLGPSLRDESLQGTGTFESEVIQSPFPFTHVALHWRGQGKGTSFELRTSPDGLDWTDWQALHIEATPSETPAGETFSSLVGAHRHGFVQYRGQLKDDGNISRVTATFLNSQDGPAVESAVLPALANPGAIDFNRAQWNCDESLRFRGKKEIWPRMFIPMKKLVVHHTVSSNDYGDGAAEVRAIYTYHAKTLGWGDIGYNVLIDRFGNSYEGRYGRELSTGREVFSPDTVAGHALAYNYGSSGAALIGSFHLQSGAELLAGGVILNRLVDVLEHMAQMREIDPQSSSPYLLSDNGWNENLPNVSGHRDCNITECPGEHVYARLGDIRAELTSRLGMAGAPTLTGPEGPPAQNTNGLSYTWTGPPGAEYSHYLEGWAKSSGSEAVTYLSGYSADRYPVWSTWTTQTAFSLSGLQDGHYTLHVRRKDGSGTTYQANKTKLIEGASSGGGKPGKGRGKPG